MLDAKIQWSLLSLILAKKQKSLFVKNTKLSFKNLIKITKKPT